jgi:nicotinate-nucleotide adenylyltransferase
MTNETSQSPTRIGLLGGSFNPAHAGHVHLSTQAIQHLGLDEVWWLVSPQNPQKDSDSMASLDLRVADAKNVTARYANIHITTLETEHETQFTCDILPIVANRYPDKQFVWLMGADNLVHFHTWKGWKEILELMPVAVFDRNPYSFAALAGTTAISQGAYRELEPNKLLTTHTPAWTYIRMPKMDISSTEIRAEESA